MQHDVGVQGNVARIQRSVPEEGSRRTQGNKEDSRNDKISKETKEIIVAEAIKLIEEA